MDVLLWSLLHINHAKDKTHLLSVAGQCHLMTTRPLNHSISWRLTMKITRMSPDVTGESGGGAEISDVCHSLGWPLDTRHNFPVVIKQGGTTWGFTYYFYTNTIEMSGVIICENSLKLTGRPCRVMSQSLSDPGCHPV